MKPTRKKEKTIKHMTKVRLPTVIVGGRQKKIKALMYIKNLVVYYTKYILKKQTK